jgi:PEP-CTERM motif
MKEVTMRPNSVAFAFLFAFAVAANASTVGVSVNGTCEAGSCPASPLSFSSIDNLPVDFTFTLPDGDMYLIDGSFSGTNNADGSGFTVNHLFQVTYEGNTAGGPSAADTISVQQFDAFQAAVSSVVVDRELIGAFSPAIAASSSASSCVNGTLGCLGPASPPGSFVLTTSFRLSSTGGAIVVDPTFTSNFGAGSPAGSYIVWGQDTALPSPVPEPATFGLLGLGLGGIIAVRTRRSHATHVREVTFDHFQ